MSETPDFKKYALESRRAVGEREDRIYSLAVGGSYQKADACFTLLLKWYVLMVLTRRTMKADH